MPTPSHQPAAPVPPASFSTRWDLRTPPKHNTPAAQLLRHTRAVSGLALLSDERLASSGADGALLLWDLRAPGTPLEMNAAPGSAPVLRIARGPWGDVIAVSTPGALLALDAFDWSAPMAEVAPPSGGRPFTDLVFNAATHNLYAGTTSGTVQVFKRDA
jgi:WD40 repeat protein